MGEELNGLREPIAEPASSGQQHPADNPLAVDAEAGVGLATASPVADRTIRLFEFLKRAQQLKTTTVHTVDQYERDGEVLWFADFPLHAALSSACRSGDPEPDDVLLIVDRVPRLSPPMPPDDLSSWLDGKVDDPDALPGLRERIAVAVNDDDGGTRQVDLSEQPAVRDAYARW